MYEAAICSSRAVRAASVEVWAKETAVEDRTRPLWQRLLFLGSLCKSLDGVNAQQEDEQVPAILNDHRQALRLDALRASLEGIPDQPALKLGIVLKLTDARVRDKESGTRFMDAFWTFVEGIGSGTGNDGDDVQRYLAAKQVYYHPFFARSPFILENYLLNYIFQNLFPFGRENNPRVKPRRIFDEYVLLATQFAWIDALLIGVASHHKEAFAEEHVVRVIQSFCRAVEHNASVLASIHEFMTDLQMNTLEGMAVLLKS